MKNSSKETMCNRLQKMRNLANDMVSDFSKRPDVEAVWFIGSVARGNIWEGSDIDLQVMVKKLGNRIEYRKIDNEDIITKFYTKNEIEKAIFEDEEDPIILAIRDSIILYDPEEYLATLQRKTRQISSRRRSLEEIIERLEEALESWQGCVKAHRRKDHPALVHRITRMTPDIIGLFYALKRIPIPNYNSTQENLEKLPIDIAQDLIDCLGLTGLSPETRFETLQDLLDRATRTVAQEYGRELAQFIGDREMTFNDLEGKLGAGPPRQLVEILSVKGIISTNQRPVLIGGTTHYEEMYSTPAKNQPTSK